MTGCHNFTPCTESSQTLKGTVTFGKNYCMCILCSTNNEQFEWNNPINAFEWPVSQTAVHCNDFQILGLVYGGESKIPTMPWNPVNIYSAFGIWLPLILSVFAGHISSYSTLEIFCRVDTGALLHIHYLFECSSIINKSFFFLVLEMIWVVPMHWGFSRTSTKLPTRREVQHVQACSLWEDAE